MCKYGDIILISFDFFASSFYYSFMARLPRIIAPGYPHHVTPRGVRSMTVFQDDDDRRRYLLFLKEETERFGVEIQAWCLMTNHVHFIATPDSETALARAFGETHRLYTRRTFYPESPPSPAGTSNPANREDR